MRKPKRLPFKESARGFRNNLTVKLLYDVASHFTSDTARIMKSAILRGRISDITSLSIDPREYTDPRQFGVDYLLCEIASKVPPTIVGVTSEHLAEVALEKFRESEVQCKDTNQRLPMLESSRFRTLYGPDVDKVFHLAREKIARVLGEFSWDECSALFGFGPGATTRLNRSKADLFYKFGPKPDTTQQCLILAAAACGFKPLGTHVTIGSVGLVAVNAWGESLIRSRYPSGLHLNGLGIPYVELVREVLNVRGGNKIVTVPKNSKTDRTIAIEPDLNMFIQKGIGGVIRRRLRGVGIDLNSQVLNQLLAEAGSKTGDLATIDLKSASDTLARRLVELMVPSDWYCAMNSVRSHEGVLSSGEVIPFQKFSSMGNGFTFELETLIFWGLAAAVAEYLNLRDRRLAVYGDDIVFPTQGAQLLMEVLKVAGFTPNTKKTFIDGPFRESCGKHFFNGFDVTPFYLRKEINHTQPLFVAVNNMRRWITRMAIHGRQNLVVSPVCPPHLWALYQKWWSRVPSRLKRFRGPDGYGDSVLIGNFEECLPNKAKRGFEGWSVLSYRLVDLLPSGISPRVDEPPLLLKSFYRLEKKMLEVDGAASSDELAVRFRSPMYQESSLLVTQFPALAGPFRKIGKPLVTWEPSINFHWYMAGAQNDRCVTKTA